MTESLRCRCGAEPYDITCDILWDAPYYTATIQCECGVSVAKRSRSFLAGGLDSIEQRHQNCHDEAIADAVAHWNIIMWPQEKTLSQFLEQEADDEVATDACT